MKKTEKFLNWLNNIFFISYPLWKKDYDRIYYKIKLDLREGWLSSINSNFSSHIPIRILILSFMLILWIESGLVFIFYLFVATLVGFGYQSSKWDKYTHKYISEKYLEMSKK